MTASTRPAHRAILPGVLTLSAILLAVTMGAALAQSPSPPASTLGSAPLDPCLDGFPVPSPSTAGAVPGASLSLSPVSPSVAVPSPSVAALAPAASLTPSGSPDASAVPCTADGTGLNIDLVASQGTTSIASSSPDPTTTPAPKRKPGRVKVRENVPYLRRQACATNDDGCIERADIYYPSNPGPWPVIVTIHGRPRFPTDMAPLAKTLAAKGAVVYNVDYRGVRPVLTKGFPEAIQDVSCAIRYARQTAHRYGGDRHHVVLVGHSMGGYVGAMVALAGDTFPSPAGRCLSTLKMRASLPDGFVSAAGVSAMHHDYLIDQVFFGGTYARIPAVWKRGTLYTHIGTHVGHNHDLKVGIIFERHDPFMDIGHATHLHRALVKAGYDADLILLDHGTTHFDILDMHRAIGQRLVKLVWHIVRETDPD